MATDRGANGEPTSTPARQTCFNCRLIAQRVIGTVSTHAPHHDMSRVASPTSDNIAARVEMALFPIHVGFGSSRVI